MTAVARWLRRNELLYEYARYRELFFFLVWRDVKIRYKQTLLGAGWAIIQPFMMMVVFTLLFGRLAKLDSGGVPYPIFYYSALVPWTYFQQAVPLAGNSLVANERLISKVYFPRAIIPAASALAGIVDFLVASLVLVGMMVYYHFPIGPSLLLWPVLLIPTSAFIIALGMFLSSLNVKYRDIKYTIPFFIQLMLFASGIIYPSNSVPEKFQLLMRINPLVSLIDGFRAAVLPGQAVDWSSIGMSSSIILVLLVLSAVYFRRTEKTFADLI